MSPDDIGVRMSIGEAVSHMGILAQDPTSWIHAALAKWEHPVSHEFFVLADLFDAFGVTHFKRPKPYPRPTPDDKRTTEHFGRAIEPADLPAVLRAFGRDVPADIAQLAAPAAS